MSDDDDIDTIFELAFMEWHEGQVEAEEKKLEQTVEIDDRISSYPHQCPKCGGPAYVGLTSVDCLKKCD